MLLHIDDYFSMYVDVRSRIKNHLFIEILITDALFR